MRSNPLATNRIGASEQSHPSAPLVGVRLGERRPLPAGAGVRWRLKGGPKHESSGGGGGGGHFRWAGTRSERRMRFSVSAFAASGGLSLGPLVVSPAEPPFRAARLVQGARCMQRLGALSVRPKERRSARAALHTPAACGSGRSSRRTGAAPSVEPLASSGQLASRVRQSRRATQPVGGAAQ